MSNTIEQENKIRDSELIERFVSGDESAFEELVNLHASKAFQISFGLLSSKQDAEEVVQDAFIKVYKKVGEHAIIQIVFENGKKIPALISKIQYDTLHEKYISIDFHYVKMGEKISATVPLVLKEKALAIKAGFILFQVLH